MLTPQRRRGRRRVGRQCRFGGPRRSTCRLIELPEGGVTMVAGMDPGRPADVLVGGEPAEPVGVPADASPGPIEGRSLRQIAWSRLKRDRVALTGGALVILL